MEEKKMRQRLIEYILLCVAGLVCAYKLGRNAGYEEGVQDVMNIIDISQK